MRLFLVFLYIMFIGNANADLASTTYVKTQTATKVDTSPDANQTMAGNYTISGTLTVPTPPLPTAE